MTGRVWWLAALFVGSGLLWAQWGPRGGYGGGGRFRSTRYEESQTAREIPQHSNETPTWTNAVGFTKDVFTFVRIKRGYTPITSGGPWWTDTPDADLNLSWRLSQMTALKVDPDGRFLRLGDRELADYPFIYMVEPGSLDLDDVEVVILRKYLLNGGFLWLDDFWGEREWANVERVLRQVFPDREWIELALDHPLYHGVFEIQAKAQIPNVELGRASQWNGGITWEREDAEEVHHRALLDDRQRLMVLATHNTDNGDGWEREGEDDYYFHQFAEKIAYPLAVNVLFYVMTH
jgi:hypothetical protein